MGAHASPLPPDFQCLLPKMADRGDQDGTPAWIRSGLSLSLSACDFAAVFSGRMLRALLASLLI